MIKFIYFCSKIELLELKAVKSKRITIIKIILWLNLTIFSAGKKCQKKSVIQTNIQISCFKIMVSELTRYILQPVHYNILYSVPRIDYEEYEHVTSLKSVTLVCEGSVTGKKGYVAVSTTSIYGEDIQCKGRVSVETITRQYSTIK